MKSYTDIEQSKKLAKLLPLESADYFHAPDAGVVITEPYKLNNGHETVITAYKGAIPCWSLSALLDLMPERISINNEASYPLTLKKSVGGYSFTYGSYKRIIDNVTTIGLTPIEAAYSMVVWLLENNYI